MGGFSRQKNFLSSVTFWGAVLAFLESLKMLVLEAIANGMTTELYFDIAIAFVGFIMSVYGRYSADSKVYTPKGYPGRDKKRYSEQIL